MSNSDSANIKRWFEQRGEIFRHYVMESKRLVVVEVDANNEIVEANLAFRARIIGFETVQGQPLSRFLTRSDQYQRLEVDVERDSQIAIESIFTALLGGERYLFYAYPLQDRRLLIGEQLHIQDHDMLNRMGNVTLDMSRLVKKLRKTNHELAHANELNQTLARTDGLTQVANRRYFMERLHAAVALAQRYRQPLCLIMLDLDFFKRINDQFGHEGGDKVLIGFAQLLLAQIRPGDFPGRLGGEEFGLYLPNTALPAALTVAERLRYSTLTLEPLPYQCPLSVSIGVASLAADEDVTQFMRRADVCLYRAKSLGRNQVIADPFS